MAPIERVVDEGALISATTVRMAMKNRLIVDALRDGRRFDADVLRAAARAQFLVLARENDETAVRVDRLDLPDDASAEHRRRPEVHRMLAAALRAAADDPERLTAIVCAARDDALQEVVDELTTRLVLRDRPPTGGPDDEFERFHRLRDFIEIDLAALEAQARRNAPPGDRS
ncbi:hypothetical protein [Planctomonas psychrotolerans]|uniref:hypothetical protein n=1 Tax=Planctomonas psychrotolerans TaxID=2528712 RepID=UPI0012391D50|nr:hypothetical protein [Planctomonas psychrotolerans]